MTVAAIDQSYTPEFFATQQSASERSAREVVPLLMDLLRPQRVIDVGCGIGTWTRVFAEHGAEVLGVDGDYVDRRQLCIPVEKFLARDLMKPLRVGVGFDLAVCLEVAEHLPPKRAAGFIADLARLAPIVAFSAAVPGQGGVQHLNEQWPEYWADLFGECGYVVVDSLRNRIWSNSRVVWHYRQNLLLFVRQSALADFPRLQAEMERQGVHSLSVVHPEMYQGLCVDADPRHMSLAKASRVFFKTVSEVLRRKLGRPKR